MAMSATYLGELRVEATHEPTGAVIISDAPLDNGGKGRGFSPTDMATASLGMCAMTIMGLYAQNHNLDITGATMKINKTMSATPPRRISKIEIDFTMPDGNFSDKDKKAFERAVKTCPVHQSLHPDVEQVFTFNW